MATLSNGGAEKSLVNLLNVLPSDKYSIDVMLFKNRGIFVKQVPPYVNLIDAPKELKGLYSNGLSAGKQLPRKLISTFIAKIAEKESEDQKGYRWHKYYSQVIPKLNQHYDVAIAYLSGEVLYFIDEKVDADRKIVFVHNDYRRNKLSHKYEEKHYRNMSKIISISNRCVEILKEEFPELTDKMLYLPNITSSTVVRNRAQDCDTPEYKDGVTNILSIGRLNHQKGFDYAIDAAKCLKDKGFKFCWSIIGNGELKKDLLKQIVKNGVEDEVQLLGIRENPYPYIQNCDFVVQTSRFEGKSVVLDEAKILGKAIVTTNYPTVNDQVENEKEGLVVEIDPAKIADGIILMATDTTRRESIEQYLNSKEYGNEKDVSMYMDLLDEKM